MFHPTGECECDRLALGSRCVKCQGLNGDTAQDSRSALRVSLIVRYAGSETGINQALADSSLRRWWDPSNEKAPGSTMWKVSVSSHTAKWALGLVDAAATRTISDGGSCLIALSIAHGSSFHNKKSAVAELLPGVFDALASKSPAVEKDLGDLE